MSFDGGEYDPHGEPDLMSEDPDTLADFFASIDKKDNSFVKKETERFGEAHGGSLDHFYDKIIEALEGGEY